MEHQISKEAMDPETVEYSQGTQPHRETKDTQGQEQSNLNTPAPQNDLQVMEPARSSEKRPFLYGNYLTAAVISVCSSGFLVFGYDQGVMSGVVISDIWLKQMGNPSTIMIGTITAIYDIGAMAGCLAAAAFGERFGRRKTLVSGCVTVIVGMLLMCTCYERVQMMFGRVVTGIGIGLITSVAPVYLSETSAPKHRGWHICCEVTCMLLGLLIAYWINYGLVFTNSSFQWRFPLAFQAIFAIYVIILTPFLPDTPRWLMRHKGIEVGTQALANLRGLPITDPKIQHESQEIQEAIALEQQGSWSDLFKDGGYQGNKRFYLALAIQFMQQLTGINIVTYYAPTIFQESIGLSHQMSLLMGGILNVWYIIASFVTWYTIERVGRRRLLISQGFGLCLCLAIEGITVGIGGSKAGIAAIVFVFVYESFFTWGWMATVWGYPPEILPLTLRTKGAALAAGAEFLSTFMVVEITPPALANIGYKTYVIFAVLNLFNVYIIWTFFPETAGKSLEEIDFLFMNKEPLENEPWYAKIQWSVVRRAKQMSGEQLGLGLREAAENRRAQEREEIVNKTD